MGKNSGAHSLNDTMEAALGSTGFPASHVCHRSSFFASTFVTAFTATFLTTAFLTDPFFTAAFLGRDALPIAPAGFALICFLICLA